MGYPAPSSERRRNVFCRGQAAGKINPFWPRSDLDKMVIAEHLSVVSARDILYFLTFSQDKRKPRASVERTKYQFSFSLSLRVCV